MEKEYRYMIWNAVKAEFQFPSICETTEKGANTCLFNCIGNDARKYRFEVVRVEKQEAKRIVKELKQKRKAERIHSILPNINFELLLNLVKKDEGDQISTEFKETIEQLDLMLKVRRKQKEIIECAGGSCINCAPDIRALKHAVEVLKEIA